VVTGIMYYFLDDN